jgi:hypothetical protein
MTDTLAPSAGTVAQTRAIVRFVEPGSIVDCATCGSQVKFSARAKVKQVICNVYTDGRWARVEHHHLDCYEAAGDPHGAADASQPMRSRRRAAGTPAT